MGATDISIAPYLILLLLLCDLVLGQKHCENGTLDAFRAVSGSSPTLPSQACDADSPIVVNKSACLYFGDRLSLSRFYDAFPYDVFYPIAPNVDNLGGEAYVAASREQMDRGARAIELFLRCGLPFSVQGGGHGNAGASVMLGRRLLNLRYLEYMSAELDEDALYSDVWDGSKDIGTVTVGAGSRSGSAMFSDGWTDVALPVGQTPSIGISGLTLGGGFGFLTRFSGLLCDRMESLVAIVPATPEGKAVTVTRDNEYADLFWASCGGGGGNFAVITEFQFSPVQACKWDDTTETCTVLKLHLDLTATVDVVMYYQEWSIKMSTRITPNLLVKNTTHITLEGIFLGDGAMWKNAVRRSGATESTPITSTDLLQSVKEMPFPKAVGSLTDWAQTPNPSKMLTTHRGEERTYWKYKSLFLFEPLPAEAIGILVGEAMYFEKNHKTKNNKVVFELQALGGDPGRPDDGSEKYPKWSPKNVFASISPKDTAFPHRGALHCLTLKTEIFMLVSGGLATRLLMQMESVFDRIEPFVNGKASHYNYIDPNLPLETPYFQNAVELNPGITEADKHYWIDRLRQTKSKYNPHDMLGNPLGIGRAPAKNIEATVAVSSGAPLDFNYLASAACVVLLTGYLLYQSINSSAVFLRHDVRWRRKSE